MELKGSKTEKNLMTAFAGESQARNKYTYFASVAKKEGYEQIAAIFLKTADNEKEHAKIWFKLLHNGGVPGTVENLKDAAAGENYEWTEMYAEFAKVAREVLEGNMREIVGKMRLEEMVSDRQKFAELVKENAEPDLAAMGLDIISFNVQNFVDSNQVIENLGIDNIVKIKKSAAIARANSEKEIKIAQARANKEANDERVLAETEIAKKNNDLAIKSAELKKESDIKKAEADAAYKIQEEQQRKELEITSANANIARQEREVELRAREVEVTEKSLEAEVKKKAEAERYAKQQQAEADLYRRQKDAEADQFEKIREAEAKKAQAEAQRYAMEQEALGIKAKGEAEAASIRAQALAEAEGMEKKAEAYQRYNKAAMAEMMIKVLPEIAGKIAEPLSQIDKITIIGGGSEDNGIGSVAGNVPVVMAKLFESMKEATGVDLSEIMRADTYDAKVNRNIQISSPEELKELSLIHI